MRLSFKHLSALVPCGMFAATCLLASSAQAETITLRQGLDGYAGNAHMTIRGHNDSGSINSAIVGTNGPDTSPDSSQPNREDRMLMSFDLSPIVTAAGGQPIVVSSAQLVMHISTGGSVVGAGNLRVETGTATTSHSSTETVDLDLHAYNFAFSPTSTWTSPASGDAVAGGTPGALLGSLTGLRSDPADQTQPATSEAMQVFDTADLAQWIADSANGMDPVARFLMLRPNADIDVRNRVFFRDLDFSTASLRPTLVVEYSVVPEPNALLLASIGFAAVGSTLRRRAGK